VRPQGCRPVRIRRGMSPQYHCFMTSLCYNYLGYSYVGEGALQLRPQGGRPVRVWEPD
jgi:hypothetical protein